MITAEQIIKIVEDNKDEAIRCLQEIVRVPSVTGDEEAVSKVFTQWIESTGLKVENYPSAPGRPNLIAEWNGSQEGKRFVFNGHMDVFPPDAKDPGLYGPWSGKLVDGKVYGRGAADMKGGDCGVLMAVKFLRQMGFDPKGSILMTYVCDEENGGGLGVNHLLAEHLIEGDFGICPEPTCGKLLITHGGIVRGWCTYTAEPQHTSIQYPGENAIQKAIKAISELYKINDRLKQIKPANFESPCLSVAVFNSGEAPNVHPSKAVFAIDRRLVPGEDHQEALDEIVAVLDKLKAEDPAYDYQLDIYSRRPFLDVPEDDPFVGICCESYKQIMGKDLILHRRAGGSDAANIQSATGIAMPNFGVALDVEDSGQPNEKIDFQGYLDFIKVYMMIVVNALS